MTINEGLLSSDRGDWNTPREVVTCLNRLWGRVQLDPCSNPLSIVGAEISVSLEQGGNGLLIPWLPRTYCNPPYGDEIPKWVKKAHQEHQRTLDLGLFGVESILLLPARPDTKWFIFARKTCQVVAFWSGRLTFLGGKTSAPFPSALFYYGLRPFKFAEAFEPHCLIWT